MVCHIRLPIMYTRSSKEQKVDLLLLMADGEDYEVPDTIIDTTNDDGMPKLASCPYTTRKSICSKLD